MSQAKQILVVLVLYEKAIAELPLLPALAQAPATDDFAVLLYDNSKAPQAIGDICLPLHRVHYIHDERNPGVSKAYNVAARYALRNGFDALLLLDDDTVLRSAQLDMYRAAYKQYGEGYIYAPKVQDPAAQKVYSPFRLAHFVGKPMAPQALPRPPTAACYDLTDRSLINSGLLIPVQLFLKIGGYNEALKLDYSDVSFVERYKAIRSECILLPLTLTHELSGDSRPNYRYEYRRFRYYCASSRVLGEELGRRVWWPPLRRMLRLIIRYRRLGFVWTFVAYYVRRRVM